MTRRGWCVPCRCYGRRGHLATARHAAAIRRPAYSEHANRPAWAVAVRRDAERPAETWIADAEHGTAPVPRWYETEPPFTIEPLYIVISRTF